MKKERCLEVEFGCQWIPIASTENRLVLIRNAWLQGCGKKVGLPIDSNRFYVEIIDFNKKQLAPRSSE